MSNVKVNSKTGQVAIARGTEPRADAVSIYNAGEYKFNPLTNQVAIPTPDGKYEIHDLTPDQTSALQSPDAIYRRQAGMVGSGVGEKTTGEGESAIRGAQQGVTFNLADEIGAATAAALAKMNGDQVAKDPEHPVTGGMANDYWSQYLNQVKGTRADNKAALESNPKIFKSTRLAGSIIPSMAIPASTAPAAIFGGAAQGAIQGAGGADTQDLKRILLESAIGAGGGAIGGALGAAGNKIFAANTPSGMAYNTIDQASPNGIRNLAEEAAQAGGSPAEQSAVLADTLKSYAAQAPRQAEALVEPAQQRMAAVNQGAVDQVDRLLSPQNAPLYRQAVQDASQQANNAAYRAAENAPWTVSLPPELTNRPSFQEALRAAQAAAADEFPPRTVDVNNLSARDINIIDKILQSTQRAATELRGDPSPAAQATKALIPTRGEIADQVRNIADTNFPPLAAARSQAQEGFAVQSAVDAGSSALAPAREAVEVAAEYAALQTPAQREAYRVGMATKLRAMLASKGESSNVGQVFDKTGLADKLIAVGFPQEAVDRIVQGGVSARAVLNALQGGSDTARKLMAAEAGKHPLSKIKPIDLILGAVGNVATMGGVKVANEAGKGLERGAARNVVEALASQGPDALRGLIFNAPQSAAPLFNILSRSAGSNNALSLFPRGYGQ